MMDEDSTVHTEVIKAKHPKSSTDDSSERQPLVKRQRLMESTGSYDPVAQVTSSHCATSTTSLITESHEPTALNSASNTIGQNEGSCDRQVVVFNMADHSSDTTPITELPDNFFDVTVEDYVDVYMQQDLQQKVKMNDAPALDTSRYSQYNMAIIRIQFPDHWVLQGSFQPHELLRTLVKFVREHLANPAVKFYLYTTPPKMILTNYKLTLVQAGLVPASIVYFGLHDNKDKEFLKTSLLQQAVSPSQADKIAMTTRNKPSHVIQLPKMETTSSDIVQAANTTHSTQHQEIVNRRTNTAVNTTKAVPKWFKHSGGKRL